ncbi:MAG: 3-5 exonuclease, partial [Microbacterium sp.]|nr:3-5 exonuclease [Microbacterium sp.]
MTAPASGIERRIALISIGPQEYVAIELDANDEEQGRTPLRVDELSAWVRSAEASDAPRWIMRTAAETYALLLGDGARITRSHDLVLCHAILRDTSAVPTPLPASPHWERREPTVSVPSLFDVFDDASGDDAITTTLDQYRAQREVIAAAPDGRLTLLCAAESAGGLIAEEMRTAGLPWDEGVHDAILTEALGARPVAGGTPSRMVELGDRVRELLGDASLHLDSQQKLLRALHRVGVQVESTSRWELA